LPKINNSLIPNLKLHWLSPEILKGEVDQRTNIKEPWLIPDGMGTKLGYGLRYKKIGLEFIVD
jgi:hypothetical protein